MTMKNIIFCTHKLLHKNDYLFILFSFEYPHFFWKNIDVLGLYVTFNYTLH